MKKKFTTSEVKLSQFEAHKVLTFYFRSVKIPSASLTEADRSFAQSLLFEGLHKSDPLMKIVNDDKLVDQFFAKLPKSLSFSKQFATSIFKKVGDVYRKEKTSMAQNDIYGDFIHWRIYADSRSAIENTYRNAWRAREATGKPVLY